MLQGHEVSRLTSSTGFAGSSFTFWVSPPPPSGTDAPPGPPNAAIKVGQTRHTEICTMPNSANASQKFRQ